MGDKIMDFLSLPHYQQATIVLIIGSFLLCIFSYLYGSLFCRMSRPSGSLPDLPLFSGSAFPTFWDKAYTFLFAAAYTVMAIGSVTTKTAPHVGISLVLSTLLMYVPMIARLFFLKAPSLPKHICINGLVGMVLSLFALCLLNGLMEAAHFSQWISETTKCPMEQDLVELFRRGSNESKLMIVLSACLVAPVGEECFFRGFLYNMLKGKTGAVAAALCSSFYFGAIHGALVQLIPLTLFGLVQCYLYERFRTLWVPMLFHFIFNTLSLTLVFFDVLPS